MTKAQVQLLLDRYRAKRKLQRGEAKVYAELDDIFTQLSKIYDLGFDRETECPPLGKNGKPLTGKTALSKNKKCAPAKRKKARKTSEHLPGGIELELSQIHIDKARFQPRSDHSQEKIDSIVNNFDPARMDPIRVWKDPKKGTYFVLAGHHRYLAYKQMNKDTVPAIVFEGTEAEAIKFAMTDNMSTRQQTTAENARYFRTLLESGAKPAEVRQEAKDRLQKNWKAPYMIAFLDKASQAVQDLEAAKAGSEIERELTTLAQWCGQITNTWQLTRAQQNELWQFARDNFRTKGKKFTSLASFSAYVERVLSQRFNFESDPETVVLRLENITPKSPGERDSEAFVLQARQEMENAKSALEKKRKEIQKRVAKGEDINADQINKVLQPFQEQYTRAQLDYVKAVDSADEQKRASQEQDIALFGLSDKLSAIRRRMLYA